MAIAMKSIGTLFTLTLLSGTLFNAPRSSTRFMAIAMAVAVVCSIWN